MFSRKNHKEQFILSKKHIIFAIQFELFSRFLIHALYLMRILFYLFATK